VKVIAMDEMQFDKIQKQLCDATSDIFDAYIAADRGPPDHVVEAFASIFDCSHNEFRKMFAKYARSKGSNLFFAHYPAFGQPGCEFDPPTI
jgi:hypothetical protein